MPCKPNKQRSKRMFNGGALSGPSHSQGGIPIEAEGGEYIIRKDSVNPETEKVLEYINKNGRLPISNAKRRRK